MSDDECDTFSSSDIVQQGPANRYVADMDDMDSDDRDQPKTFMSVVCGSGSLGVAYYSLETTVLCMMPDAAETSNYDILRKVFQQVQPSCVVVSAKQDEQMTKALHDIVLSAGLNPTEHVEILPSIDFAVDVCKRRIMHLSLPAIPLDCTDADRLLYISSLVPLHNVLMLRAVGGLIKFLERQRIGVELEEVGMKIPIIALRLFTLDDFVLVDDNSYSALQIFKLESHPSGFKAETAREGFSVYGILNRCKSKAGSQMLRQWFRHPLLDIRRLNERYDTIEFFINPRNIEVTSSLEACLKNIKHIARVLGRMMQAEASLGDWHALYKTVYNAINIGDICRSQSSEIAIFTKIGHTFSEGLHKVANLISKIVDFEESTVSGRFVVKPHVNATLDEKKRMYNGLPDLMTKVAQEEMKNMSDDIIECAVVYLPQLGYLLALSPTERMNRLQDYSLPGMQFMFLSSNKVHYKTASTRKLDSQLGDTHCDIMDLETEIMHRLQNSILQESTLLLDVVQFAAELDCLIALANCARENNYCRPQLSDSNVILIRAGRHPLQELCCSETQFVPNDTDSGPDGGRLKLLTGTNASGKSVYLKQVGLIVFMAQVGSFVPAEAAVIGVVDKIFTRMRTMESISLNLSAFAIDLSQVSAAVRYATERSLIILDEFGKGTEMEDGAALLCACLKYWLARADSCPHIFVSTHFHGIIQQKLLSSSAQLRYQTMDVLEDDGQLVFLYQLIEGVTNSSHALHVGLKAGIPQDILDRAAQVEDLRHRNLPVGRLQRSATQNELKRCAAAATRFLQLDLNNDNLTDFLGTCTARQ